MPGPTPKPPSQRQRRNRPKDMRVIPGGLANREVPPPPDGLLKQTRETWDRYWRSDIAQLAEPDTDLEALERLFSLYDERRRAYRSFRKERFVEGSKGQRVLNPLGRLISDLDKEIRMLEDRFGLTPKSRLALGISFGEMTKSMSDLNRELAEDIDHDDSDEAAEDPREISA